MYFYQVVSGSSSRVQSLLLCYWYYKGKNMKNELFLCDAPIWRIIINLDWISQIMSIKARKVYRFSNKPLLVSFMRVASLNISFNHQTSITIKVSQLSTADCQSKIKQVEPINFLSTLLISVKLKWNCQVVLYPTNESK